MISCFHIQRVPPPCYRRTLCTRCVWSEMKDKNSELHRSREESELKITTVFLTQLDLFLLEKSAILSPARYIKETKRLEKYRLGFLIDKNLWIEASSDFCTCLFFELSCPCQLSFPSIVPSVRFLYLEIVSNEICRSRYIVSLTNRAYQDF